MTGPIRVTAVVICRNEELAIAQCLAHTTRFDQVVVVDSASSDRTVDVARSLGAEVVQFQWNGRYPKKKQWSMMLPQVRNRWVLLLDADELPSAQLVDEIGHSLSRWERTGVVAVDLPLSFYWLGTRLKHGYQVRKLSLVRPDKCHFPDVGDDNAPGITEVEGHYQVEIDGARATAIERLVHLDPDPFKDWVARHNRYSDWEAYLHFHPNVEDRVRGARSVRGRLFRQIPGKAVAFFLYGYVLKFGFLDGRAGLNYALANSFYYWMTSVKIKEADSYVRG